MRMRTRQPVILMVGVGALLVAALAVLITPRAQIVHAQDEPSVTISLNSVNGVTQQGQ